MSESPLFRITNTVTNEVAEATPGATTDVLNVRVGETIQMLVWAFPPQYVVDFYMEGSVLESKLTDENGFAITNVYTITAQPGTVNTRAWCGDLIGYIDLNVLPAIEGNPSYTVKNTETQEQVTSVPGGANVELDVTDGDVCIFSVVDFPASTNVRFDKYIGSSWILIKQVQTNTLGVASTGLVTMSGIPVGKMLTRAICVDIICYAYLVNMTLYPVQITVVDTSSDPIANAEVSFGGTSAFTNSSGVVNFEARANYYEMYIEKMGYNPLRETIQVTGSMNLTKTLSPTSGQNYTVNIHVTDDLTSGAISGAEVIFNAIQKTTPSSGTVSYIVQPGTYSLIVSAEGYETFDGDESINSNVNLNIALTSTTNGGGTYTVNFTIRDAVTLALLEGVNVNFAGASKTTGVDGVASFTANAGHLPLTVTKAGYETLSTEVTVSTNLNIRIPLTPITPPDGTTPPDWLIPAVALGGIAVVAYTASRRRRKN